MRRMVVRSLLAALLVVPMGVGVVPAPAGSAETCRAETFDPFTSGDPRLQLNNAAAITDDGRLRVTPNLTSQAGSAFTSSPITLADDASFSSAFSFQFSEPFGGGADGLVFVVQTVASTVGGHGGGIGYEGLADSLGVEFDNYHNEPVGDPNDSHVGIDLHGSVESVQTALIEPNLDLPVVRHAWVDYDGSSQTLTVRVSATDERPEEPTLTRNVDLLAVLGSPDAYLGFTSGTGAAASNHDVLSWTFANCFAPLGTSTPPSVDAGPGVTGPEDTALALDGQVSDADPEEKVATAWSAPAGSSCAFADASAVDTTVTCSDPGTYTLTLLANDGVNPPVSDTTTVTVTAVAVFSPIGYRMVASDGGVFTFGQRTFHGSLGDRPIDPSIVGGADDPTTYEGYWLAGRDGRVFAFGSARFFGSLDAAQLTSPIVEIEPTPTGLGYWLVAADGAVFPFGDAKPFGGLAGTPLNGSVIGMAATSTGQGYWLVASDGGIFAFGDAPFHGSMGAAPLNAPIDDLAPLGDDSGYYLVGRDGGVFTFGAAPFHGSTGSMTLNKPVIGMLAHPDGSGYWLAATDGGVFTFGALPFFGSMGDVELTSPVNDLIH